MKYSPPAAPGVGDQAFSAIQKLSGIGVLQVNPHNGQIIRANNRYAEIVGYTPSQLRGMTIYKITHPEDCQRDADALRNLLDNTITEYCTEKRYLRSDGGVVWGRLTATLIRDNEGNPICSLGLLQDITHFRVTESALHNQQEAARASRVTSMAELAVQIAHEINQPLTAITTYTHGCLARLTKVKNVPPEILEALEQAHAQAHRAGEIVRRMKKLARRDKPSRVPVEINQLLRRASQLAIEARPSSGVRVDAEFATNLPNISVDVTQMEQVVINLVTNAIDAVLSSTQPRRHVSIRTSLSDDGSVIVSVVDNGPGLVGIRPDELFVPFVTTKTSGIGMGLSISRSIVEAHGGRLTATANPDHGMTFQFTLPPPNVGKPPAT